MNNLRILAIILILFAFAGCSHAVKIGDRSYGYVEKEYYGNQTSSETIAIIIGVHPREYGVHNAMKYQLRNSSLKKRYVLYHVHVTRNPMGFSGGRMRGQLLARDFVVPDVKRENPMLVVDCHQNAHRRVGYRYSRFIHPVSGNTKTWVMVNEIKRAMPFLRIYRPPVSTSPAYVTIPIASRGYNTIIYETNGFDTKSRKLRDARKLLGAIDQLK